MSIGKHWTPQERECARMLMMVGALDAVERVIRKATEGART